MTGLEITGSLNEYFKAIYYTDTFSKLGAMEIGIEACNTSLSGQMTRSGTSRSFMTLMVFKNTLDIEMPKQ